MKPNVVVAGATGFIGRALVHRLTGLRTTAVSRSGASVDGYDEARRCDLFSLKDAETALSGADLAVYLVHSMMPSARLSQGHFEDFDLLCADNFGRAAKQAGVKRIVYVGGLLPRGDQRSRHLESRREVELALGAHGVPVTTLRAGVVLGAGGSSFTIMTRLVKKLPVMVCPAWTETPTQPIALDDLARLIAFALVSPACEGKTFDVGGPDVLSYREMMELTAELLGRRLRTVSVPLFSPELSRLWLTLVTGAPRELAGPLVSSLRHELLARERTLHALAGVPGLPVREALQRALSEAPESSEPKAFTGVAVRTENLVRSVQRMRLPEGRDAEFAADEYMRFLPARFRGLIHVDVDDARDCRFYLGRMDEPLLVLRHVPRRSGGDRQLFHVTGGLLVRKNDRARFELRRALDERTLLAAIHEFAPRLPWFVYVLTQARAHAFVMWLFGRHLARLAPAPSAARTTAGPDAP